MTHTTYLAHALPVWNKLTPAQQQLLQNNAVMRYFKKGEALHSGSADCSGLFLVKSGQVRAFILSETGREITLYQLFERDICLFSASCMLSSIQFEIYLTAEKDTEALLIPTAVYKELMEQSAVVANFTNQLMASRFTDVMWLIEQVLFKSMDTRLASFLLAQQNINQTDTLHLTQEEMAQHMGTAREVVTRLLKYFQAEGMVHLFRGGITITDTNRLQQLADA
ncbi:MAG: Crp/Fnr family transcriptional regulator [Oscillospiraceae bacterium]|nr:Crp/Fnr family transcriptional regulator [Oscillospiraceae bacterium]